MSLSATIRRTIRAVTTTAVGQVAIGYLLATVDPWIGEAPKRWILDCLTRDR